jgi:hypothetical protein
MLIEMGIGWVKDENSQSGIGYRSANPGEYANEIVRLRAALTEVRTVLMSEKPPLHAIEEALVPLDDALRGPRS